MKVELPFKCKPEEFENNYQEQYKNRITHGFIRSNLGLSDSVKLKLNGTFDRWLYLLDEYNYIYWIRYKVQTALWFNKETGKWQYVSIFPSYIKKYCQPCLDMLEYISCQVGKGENVFRHIDDPKEIFDYEDPIVSALKRIAKNSETFGYPALMNSRYTDVYNRPLLTPQKSAIAARRFFILYGLVLVARQYFGRQNGVLSLLNAVILL